MRIGLVFEGKGLAKRDFKLRGYCIGKCLNNRLLSFC